MGTQYSNDELESQREAARRIRANHDVTWAVIAALWICGLVGMFVIVWLKGP